MFANVALVFNFILLIAAMSLLQATLTLPGIAGMVLTLGMAVDANVLIHERIREEIRAGRGPVMAIDAGYRSASGTITDSNLTVIISSDLPLHIRVGHGEGLCRHADHRHDHFHVHGRGGRTHVHRGLAAPRAAAELPI